MAFGSAEPSGDEPAGRVSLDGLDGDAGAGGRRGLRQVPHRQREAGVAGAARRLCFGVGEQRRPWRSGGGSETATLACGAATETATVFDVSGPAFSSFAANERL